LSARIPCVAGELDAVAFREARRAVAGLQAVILAKIPKGTNNEHG
jgi:hypothetical protein